MLALYLVKSTMSADNGSRARDGAPAQPDHPTRQQVLANQLRLDTNSAACLLASSPTSIPVFPSAKMMQAGRLRVPHDSEVVKTLLCSLTFASQTTREEAIPDAFQHTFDWIFGERPSQDPAGEDMWSPFSQWLKSGSSTFIGLLGSLALASRP